MIDFGISRQDALALVNTLTPRETEVAQAIAMGDTRAAIAEQMQIALKTVDHYIFKVLKKLRVTKHGVGRIWFAAHHQ